MEALLILAVVQSGDELIPLQAGGVGSQLIEDQRKVVFAECGKILLHLCQAAGLPNRTVHSLRHTNITMQIAAGVPLVTVSGRAGHARTSTTTDIYSHFLKSSDRTAAKTLENVFCKG